MWVPRLLPCVDYPQHLALADIAARLSNQNAPEHATHQLSLFTYNGLFHVLVAALRCAMPIETAGRLVVSGSLFALGAAVLALLRSLRRPPEYAAFFIPILFSFAAMWGFVNYVLATAIAGWALVFIARTVLAPTLGRALVVALLGLLCAYAHVLGMLVLCLLGAAIAPELAWRSTDKGLAHARVTSVFYRTFIALAPLLIGCLFCIAVYQEQYLWNPGMYTDPVLEGTRPPLWKKLVYFGSYATDLHPDKSDKWLLWSTIVILIVTIPLRRRSKENASIGPIYLPLVAGWGAYLATPVVVQGTHLIFQRLAQAAILGLILATPTLRGGMARVIRGSAILLASATGINLVIHAHAFAQATDDASRVIDAMPEGRKAAALVFDPKTTAFQYTSLTHMQGYYAARKHGDWAFSFARYLSVPVRFKLGAQPAWPTRGWEFEASNYNPRCKYARIFDLLLVRAPPEIPSTPEGEATLRARIFGPDANDVRLIAHHGRYWGFDTAGLPTDGTY